MQYETYAKIRDAKGLKDIDVARGTGLQQVMFSNWKHGKYQPKIDKIDKITRFLGMPTNEIEKVEVIYDDPQVALFAELLAKLPPADVDKVRELAELLVMKQQNKKEDVANGQT